MVAIPKRAVPYNFDPVFERAVVTLCCSRPRFYGRIGYELDPELLKADEAKVALRACHQINKELGHGPDKAVLVLQRLRRWMADGKVTFELIQKVSDYFDDAEDEGLPADDDVVAELKPVLQERIRDDAVQAGIEAFAKHGDLKKVVELEERAQRIGTVDTSVGAIMSGNDDVFTEIASLENLDRRPTGILELDSHLDGGLARGGLGVAIGGSGDGKSMFLAHVGGVSMLNKLFVGYATLELPRPIILARLMANITGVPINELTGGVNTEAQKILSKLQLGRAVVQEFPAQATTMGDIEDWVKRCEDQAGEEMSMLIVDYGDKLVHKTSKKSEEGDYVQGRAVFERMRLFAHERKTWCWTAAQANRRKDRKRDLDLDDVAESMHKVRVADLVLTLNLSEEDEQRYVRIKVAKHRHGKSRMSVGPFPVEYEFGRMCAVVI